MERERAGQGIGDAGSVVRTFPAVRLLLYYAALFLMGALLTALVPGLRDAITAPISQASPEHIDKLNPGPIGTSTLWPGIFGRGATTVTLMLWALATTLPVAWAMKHTRQLRYDPSLVQALILLPIVVSGVVLVVKNSLALAFALAGIVAGVRFRQKLDEPEQAVYVLLALGIGLASGVQALDVAWVMSLVFTLIVLVFWRYDVGDIFAGGRGAALVIGDPRLLTLVDVAVARGNVTEGIKATGMLVIMTRDPEALRPGLEVILGRFATEWQIGEPKRGPRGGPARIEILMKLKDKCDPADIIAELELRLADELSAAQYVPFGGSTADG